MSEQALSTTPAADLRANAPGDRDTRALFEKLEPGQRVEVVHKIKIGLKEWDTTTVGTVVRTERRRHGLHYRRNLDDKVFSDMVILSRDDGELTTITLDEFTKMRRL